MIAEMNGTNTPVPPLFERRENPFRLGWIRLDELDVMPGEAVGRRSRPFATPPVETLSLA